MKKIQDALLKVLGSVGRMKVKGLPRALVIVLMLLIIGSVCLYLAGWVWVWAFQQRVDLPALNALLQTLTSASFIAAAGFILRAQLAQTTAQTAYIAMMGDMELPVNTDTVQQPSLKEGSDDDDEQMV